MVSAATIWLITSNSALQSTVTQALTAVSCQLQFMATPQEAMTLFTVPATHGGVPGFPEPLSALMPAPPPTLVLIDESVQDASGLDGFTLCHHLHQQIGWHGVPIVMILATAASKASAFQAGATECLVMPLHPTEVRLRVQHWCRWQQLEADAQEQQKQLHKVDQSLQLMLQALAHDLRNPVLGMQMVFRNLLACTNPATTDNRDVISLPRSFVERMVDGTDRHLSLIDALMDVHADMIRPLSLTLEPWKPSQDLPVWLEELRPQLAKNKATLSLQVPSDLPTLQVDVAQLRRVFRNLIENAVNHNRPGVSLWVSAEAVENGVCFAVQDDGVGLAPDVGDRMFRLCQRGGDTGRTHGLGLGLYLCQRIVEAHGGAIQGMNCPDGGARFWFTLPQTVAPVWAANPCEAIHPASLG